MTQASSLHARTWREGSVGTQGEGATEPSGEAHPADTLIWDSWPPDL